MHVRKREMKVCTTTIKKSVVLLPFQCSSRSDFTNTRQNVINLNNYCLGNYTKGFLRNVLSC